MYSPAQSLQPGSVDISPGWFAAGHLVSISFDYFTWLQLVMQAAHHPLAPSANFQNSAVQSWVRQIQPVEILFNGITALINRPLYDAGSSVIAQLHTGLPLSWTVPVVQEWQSVFSAVGLIANRKTLPHKDPGGWPQAYDLLGSFGAHSDARLVVDDVGCAFDYNPGTMVGICGRVLQHSCTDWTGHDRVCLAHYVKQSIFDRLKVPTSSWVPFTDYKHLMDPGYVSRQW